MMAQELVTGLGHRLSWVSPLGSAWWAPLQNSNPRILRAT